MTISILKSLPNLYTGKKIKKIINQQQAALRKKQQQPRIFKQPKIDSDKENL